MVRIFVVAATSTFVRFIRFAFGRDYLDYLDTTDIDSQKAFANHGKDAFVQMQSTKLFNIQSREGRRGALCHILAIIRWYDRHNQHQLASESEAYSSDSSGSEGDDDPMETGNR